MYKPINCNFYDYLEALATLKQQACIVWNNETTQQTTYGIIANLFSKDKVEYLQLTDTTTIRLDYIISVNDQYIATYC